MGFLDEVAEHVPPQRGEACSVTKWVAGQPDVTAADIRLSAETLGKPATYAAMQKRGYGPGIEALRRHLRGECKCLS